MDETQVQHVEHKEEQVPEPEPVAEEDDSLQKPAKKKRGRPPLTEKQKAALAAGREKSRRNMAKAMAKQKLETIEKMELEEKPKEEVEEKVEVKAKKPKPKPKVVVLSDSEDSDDQIVYVKRKKKKRAKRPRRKIVVESSSSDEDSSDDDGADMTPPRRVRRQGRNHYEEPYDTRPFLVFK